MFEKYTMRCCDLHGENVYIVMYVSVAFVLVCFGFWKHFEAYISIQYEQTIRRAKAGITVNSFFYQYFFSVRVFIFYMCCVYMQPNVSKEQEEKNKDDKKICFSLCVCCCQRCYDLFLLLTFLFLFVCSVSCVSRVSMSCFFFFCEKCALKSFSSFFIRFYFS